MKGERNHSSDHGCYPLSLFHFYVIVRTRTNHSKNIQFLYTTQKQHISREFNYCVCSIDLPLATEDPVSFMDHSWCCHSRICSRPNTDEQKYLCDYFRAGEAACITSISIQKYVDHLARCYRQMTRKSRTSERFIY